MANTIDLVTKLEQTRAIRVGSSYQFVDECDFMDDPLILSLLLVSVVVLVVWRIYMYHRLVLVVACDRVN